MDIVDALSILWEKLNRFVLTNIIINIIIKWVVDESEYEGSIYIKRAGCKLH